MDLQEIITRGRFLFGDSPERLGVFELVNGRRTAQEIARRKRRHVNNVRRDLKLIENVGLIANVVDGDGRLAKKDGYSLYDKVPLARAIPKAYFLGPTTQAVQTAVSGAATAKSKPRSGRRQNPIAVPSETEVLDICRSGEDQLHEFKGRGTETNKIAREIAAMLNTRAGGALLYGVDDSGTIQGADVTRQGFDQAVQNSVRNTISPRQSLGFTRFA